MVQAIKILLQRSELDSSPHIVSPHEKSLYYNLNVARKDYIYNRKRDIKKEGGGGSYVG